jgi:hypothetical protein
MAMLAPGRNPISLIRIRSGQSVTSASSTVLKAPLDFSRSAIGVPSLSLQITRLRIWKLMEMKRTLSFVLMMASLGIAVPTIGNAHAQSSAVTFDGGPFIPR